MLESWFSFGYCSFYYPIPRIISLLSLQIFVSIVQFSRCVSRTLSDSVGGDEEDRTPDPLRARQVLSQLSYTPVLTHESTFAGIPSGNSAPSKMNNEQIPLLTRTLDPKANRSLERR